MATGFASFFRQHNGDERPQALEGVTVSSSVVEEDVPAQWVDSQQDFRDVELDERRNVELDRRHIEQAERNINALRIQINALRGREHPTNSRQGGGGRRGGISVDRAFNPMQMMEYVYEIQHTDEVKLKKPNRELKKVFYKII